MRSRGASVALVMTSAAAELAAAIPPTTHPIHRTDRDESGTELIADLDSIFSAGSADFRPIVPAEDDLAALLYTSGTTADPKGVMLTHANLVGEANAVFGIMKIGPSDALLGILPMFHVLAQMANLFLPLFNGARVVYLETLNTTELLRALRERNITAFCVVPQFFYLIHEKIFKALNERGKFTMSVVRTLMAFNRALRRIGINVGKLVFRKDSRHLRPRHALSRNRRLAVRSRRRPRLLLFWHRRYQRLRFNGNHRRRFPESSGDELYSARSDLLFPGSKQELWTRNRWKTARRQWVRLPSAGRL